MGTHRLERSGASRAPIRPALSQAMPWAGLRVLSGGRLRNPPSANGWDELCRLGRAREVCCRPVFVARCGAAQAVGCHRTGRKREEATMCKGDHAASARGLVPVCASVGSGIGVEGFHPAEFRLPWPATARPSDDDAR